MSVFSHRSFFAAAAALVFSLLISMSITPLATAQTSGDELFAFYEGDIWAWSPDRMGERLTTTGYTGGPVISPDGSRIAYRAVAPEFVQVIESGADGETFAGDPPADIYIMETATRTVTQVASQFVYPITRSAPVWSPDGSRIAWTQTAGEEPTVDVIVYDTRNGQMQQVATLELAFQDNGLVMPFLQWGNGGIARLVYSYGAAATGGAEGEGLFWDVINPDAMNDVQRIPAVDMSVPGAFVVAWMWAEHQGQDHIVYADQTNNWFALNVQTRTRSQLLNAPMRVRAAGGQESRLTPVLEDPDVGGIRWDFSANGITVGLPHYPYSVASGYGLDPVLSPDGRYAAWYGADGGVHTWDSINNTWVTAIYGLSIEEAFTTGPMNVAWAPMKWVTDGNAVEIPTSNPAPETTPTPAAPESQPPVTQPPVTDETSACPLPPQLTIGMAVQVTPGDPNRVRSTPSLRGAEIGLLFHGTIATVQEGPVCADGLNWWRVSWDGGDGWTVEGANGVYWLVPVG